MINLGHNWGEVHWPDNWTATTVDGKKSAQFEETLLYVVTVIQYIPDLTVTTESQKKGLMF